MAISSVDPILSGPVVTSQDAFVHPRNVRFLAPIGLVCLLLAQFVFRNNSMHSFCLGVATAMLSALTITSFTSGRRR